MALASGSESSLSPCLIQHWVLPLPSFDKSAVALVADVGGTNTRIALAQGKKLLPGTIQKFRNEDTGSFENSLDIYLDGQAVRCYGVAVAIAGPVRDNKGKLTNLDWMIQPDAVRDHTGAKTVVILNDLQAQGHALGHIEKKHLFTINAGKQSENGTRLVIGVGTGFNAAVIYETKAGRLVPPSESGHAGMPASSELELALSQFVGASYQFSAIEDVLSGRGLENTYTWMSEKDGNNLTKQASSIMRDIDTDLCAQKSVDRFVKTLGKVTGDLSLVHLPFGGISLIGGVARAMRPFFHSAGFHNAFCAKGRFKDFMQQFHIDLVEDDFAALNGLARHLDEETRNHRG